jgi:putative transposase
MHGVKRGFGDFVRREAAVPSGIDVLLSQGRPVAEAIRTISVTAFTYYRWRKEFGGLKSDQVKRLKDLEKENERLRKAVSDLTLEKLILREAASGNY